MQERAGDGPCMSETERKNTLACRMKRTGRHSGGVSKVLL